jgi:NAD(P)-dependent dehydrogenase (short-subunit alcohol dehydrogenase family)
MRGSDPAIFLVPGVGMFSFGADSQTARVAGEFYINAINVIRGAESVSSYVPVPEAEKFRVEYWMLEEMKLRRRPPPQPLTGKVALVTGAGSGIGRAIAERFATAGAVVVVVDLNLEAAEETAAGIGSSDAAVAVQADVTSDRAVEEAIEEAVVAFGGVDIVVNNAGLSRSKTLMETTEEDWDVQHDVMAKGSFLVSKHAAAAMIAQGRGGDIVYVVSKNAVVAGPNNLAYGSAKASQAHQVRLLAAELGEHGIRVNGINPDGVVQGSGIFAGGWGADRAKVYGVPEEELGRFYAGRTLLKQEVLPEHVAAAALALVAGTLSRTTGLVIPVDGGVAPAFLR